jgi:saccharopine dehydrogenase (NAD+, L-lysine forming)
MKLAVIQETKNRWERRTPLIPSDAAALAKEHGVEIVAVTSPIRIFPDSSYREKGADVVYSPASADVVMGIKEPPIDAVGEGQTFLVFSHTIKGQDYNMPLLKRFLDQGATLIDYEPIADEAGRRLIAFGRYAGIAGAIDTIWGLARRLDALGIEHPVEDAKLTWEYGTTAHAWESMANLGRRIHEDGFPEAMAPVVLAIVGCGNVGQGAGEVLDHLGAERVTADQLGSLPNDPRRVFRVDLVEQDLYVRRDGSEFVLQEYYDHPELFRSVADGYLDHITALINTAYWDARYPRVVPRESLRRFADSRERMLVVGDVACDVEGSVEATTRCTDLDDPAFVYDPLTGESPAGFEGRGTAVLSVDHLPCELSEEASTHFSRILGGLLPGLIHADLGGDLAQAGLPPELERAVIVWRGELAPNYRYLQDHLDRAGL